MRLGSVSAGDIIRAGGMYATVVESCLASS